MYEFRHRKVIVLLLGLLLAVVGCRAPTLDDSLDDARASIAEGDFATAQIYLRNALQADADSIAARMLLADVALHAGDLPAALAQLEWVRDADTPAEVYAVPLARVYTDLGDPNGALNLLEAAGLENSPDGVVWLIRADALIARGDEDGSEAALAQAEIRGAQSVETGIRRARLAAGRGDADAARQLISEVLAEDSDFPAALAFRASLAAGFGDAAVATRDFERAVELYLGSGQALRAAPLLLALVELRLSVGEAEQADVAAQRLATLLPDAPISNYGLALVAYRAGRYADAVTALRSVLAQAPDDLRIRSLFGASHLAAGNLGQAEQQFMEILSRNSNDSVILRLLVETRLRQERPQAALEAFDTFHDAVDINDLALITLRAQAYLQTGDSIAAIPSLQRALELNPGSQAIVLQLVEAQLRAGDAEAAAATLREAPELNEDADLAASIGILMARMQAGGMSAGAAFVERLVAERTDSTVAHMTAAVFHQLSGDIERALAAVQQSLDHDPDLVSANIMRGSLLQRLGQGEPAKTAYDQAIKLAPQSATALGARALLAASERDHALAAELFSRAFEAAGSWNMLANWVIASRLAGVPSWAEPVEGWLEDMPDDLSAWMLLAEQRRVAGQSEPALIAYEAIILRDENNVVALNNAAWLSHQLGRAGALEYARHAAELAPDNGAVLDTLGWILVQESMADEGIGYLERATQLLPEAAEIQYHLAVSQAELGDKAAAQESLDSALTGELPADVRRDAERLSESL